MILVILAVKIFNNIIILVIEITPITTQSTNVVIYSKVSRLMILWRNILPFPRYAKLLKPNLIGAISKLVINKNTRAH